MEWLHLREPVSAWTHGVWMLLCLPASFVLWRAGRGDTAKRCGFLVYGLTLAFCFAGSALFHGVRLPAAQLELFHRMDMIGIYLLIAGTVTPIALVMLRGRWQQNTLWGAWLMALGGVVLYLIGFKLHPALSTGLYLAMGWGVALNYFMLVRVLSHRILRPVVVGGCLYSVGAVAHVLKWPALAPGVFGAHELFHVFVMAGSFTHFWFMLKVVAPYQRPMAEVEALAGPTLSPAPRPVLAPILLTDPPLHQSNG